MSPEPQRDIAYSTLAADLEETVITGLMSRALANRNLLSLAAGFTDNDSLPHGLVAEAVQALLGEGGDATVLQYGTNQGLPRLRAALLEQLAAEPQEAIGDLNADHAFITNGSQQALYLAMQTLCDPGDIVLVEKPSYFVYLEMLRGLKIEAVEMPAHEDGRVDLEQLDALLSAMQRGGRAQRVKACYLMGYFANPSTRSLKHEEKTGLVQLLSTHGLIIPLIEDAAYRQLYYERSWPVPSLFSFPEAAEFPILYLGTFTKPFASGMKIGYGLCNRPEWLQRMLRFKGHQDFGSSNFTQRILDWVITSGHFSSHLAKVQSRYFEKAKTLHRALVEFGLPELGWQWQFPAGGIYLWLKAPEDLDCGLQSTFCERCIEGGVLYVPGDLCFASRAPTHFVRASLGSLAPESLVESARRFTDAARCMAMAKV